MQTHNNTETIPLPVMNIEKKTLPVACPWCNTIFGVAKLNIEGGERISPVHKICRKCLEVVQQDIFPANIN